jgi:hypothetical protein
VEVIEIVAGEQRRFVDVGARHMRAEMADHRRAEGRDDILAADILVDLRLTRLGVFFGKHPHHLCK